MNWITGLDCAVMRNSINNHTPTHKIRLLSDHVGSGAEAGPGDEKEERVTGIGRAPGTRRRMKK